MASSKIIAENRKARHLYNIEKTFDAGVVLQGWEVKSIRAGHVQLAESYVLVRHGELFWINADIAPLDTVSTHFKADPRRTRKLLMHRHEIDHLSSAAAQKGLAIVPLKIFWHNGIVKLEVALAKGKKLFDKRQSERDKSWERDKLRLKKVLRQA